MYRAIDADVRNDELLSALGIVDKNITQDHCGQFWQVLRYMSWKIPEANIKAGRLEARSVRANG